MDLTEAIEEAADKIAKAFIEAALKLPQDKLWKALCSHCNGVPNDDES